MTITTFQGETTIDQLAGRIYGDRLKLRPDLTSLLLKANPRLNDLGTLPPGTPIVVPSADPPGAASDARFEAARDRITEALNRFEQRQTERLDEREAALRDMLAITARRDVAEALANEPEAAARLDAIKGETNTALAATAADRTALQATLLGARSIVTGNAFHRRPGGR